MGINCPMLPVSCEDSKLLRGRGTAYAQVMTLKGECAAINGDNLPGYKASRITA